MLPILQYSWQQCLTHHCSARSYLIQIAQRLRIDLTQLFHMSQL